MNEVVVVGSGPAGLMLAGELALAGIDVAIVERRPTPELVGSRAGGFHARTLEILNQRGIADRFLAEGQIAQAARFGNTVLDISDFPHSVSTLAGAVAEPPRADTARLGRGTGGSDPSRA